MRTPVKNAFLVGASAFALAAVTPSGASAAEFDMKVGGFFEVQVGYASTETDADFGVSTMPNPDEEESLVAPTVPDANGRLPANFWEIDGVDVKRDSEIHFEPSLTLDNGIRVGALVELEGATEDSQIDNSFLFAEGSFGRLLLGAENSAGYLMHYSAPDISLIGANDGDMGDWVIHENGYNEIGPGNHATNHELTGDNAERVTWFSPRINGFQFGISYARDDEDHSNAQVDISGAFTDEDGDGVDDTTGRLFYRANNAKIANVVDLGLNWIGDLAGIDLAVSGRYGIAFADQPYGTNDDFRYHTSSVPRPSNRRAGDHSPDEIGNPQVWSAGLNLGWEGWTIGGSFGERNLNDDSDGQAFDAGVSYETGPWAFSFTYFHGENVIDDIYWANGDANRSGGDSHNDDGPVVIRSADRAPFTTPMENLENFVVGVRYRLAKGVDLHGFAGYSIYGRHIAYYTDIRDERRTIGRNEADVYTRPNDLVDDYPPQDSHGYVVGTGVRIAF